MVLFFNSCPTFSSSSSSSEDNSGSSWSCFVHHVTRCSYNMDKIKRRVYLFVWEQHYFATKYHFKVDRNTFLTLIHREPHKIEIGRSFIASSVMSGHAIFTKTLCYLLNMFSLYMFTFCNYKFHTIIYQHQIHEYNHLYMFAMRIT